MLENMDNASDCFDPVLKKINEFYNAETAEIRCKKISEASDRLDQLLGEIKDGQIKLHSSEDGLLKNLIKFVEVNLENEKCADNEDATTRAPLAYDSSSMISQNNGDPKVAEVDEDSIASVSSQRLPFKDMRSHIDSNWAGTIQTSMFDATEIQGIHPQLKDTCSTKDADLLNMSTEVLKCSTQCENGKSRSPVDSRKCKVAKIGFVAFLIATNLIAVQQNLINYRETQSNVDKASQGFADSMELYRPSASHHLSPVCDSHSGWRNSFQCGVQTTYYNIQSSLKELLGVFIGRTHHRSATKGNINTHTIWNY